MTFTLGYITYPICIWEKDKEIITARKTIIVVITKNVCKQYRKILCLSKILKNKGGIIKKLITGAIRKIKANKNTPPKLELLSKIIMYGIRK